MYFLLVLDKAVAYLWPLVQVAVEKYLSKDQYMMIVRDISPNTIYELQQLYGTDTTIYIVADDKHYMEGYGTVTTASHLEEYLSKYMEGKWNAF